MPSRYKTFLDFIPTLAYVQAHSTFDINITFKPTLEIFEKMDKFIDKEKSNDTEKKILIPIKITVANQVIPILFDIIAILTTDEIIF